MRKKLVSILIRNNIEEMNKVTRRRNAMASARYACTYLSQSAPDLGVVMGSPAYMREVMQGYAIMSEFDGA